MKDTKVYPYSLEIALQNNETDAYHASAQINQECIAAIDEAIAASCYDNNYYNLSSALTDVTKEFGLDRVAYVVAATVQTHLYDGRYSQRNKDWATEVSISREDSRYLQFKSHPYLLNSFADKIRNTQLHEMAQTVGAYEIKHHMAERNRLTGLNPDTGAFVPHPGVTERRLKERCEEISAKQSVSAHQRAARKAEKIASAPEKKHGLAEKRVQAEADHIMSALQNMTEPNSPQKRHFIVPLSQDFIQSASTGDMDKLGDKLAAHFPKQAFFFTVPDGEKGPGFIIESEAVRPASERKPSIKEQLVAHPISNEKTTTAKKQDRGER